MNKQILLFITGNERRYDLLKNNQLTWYSQRKKDTYDNDIKNENNTLHVFYRSRYGKNFIYNGKVIKRSVLNERNKKHQIKMKMKFILENRNDNIFVETILPDLNYNGSSKKYKINCFKFLNMIPVSKNFNEGIMFGNLIKNDNDDDDDDDHVSIYMYNDDSSDSDDDKDITKESIHYLIKKMEQIKTYTVPHTRDGIKTFLSMIMFYRDFVSNLSEKAIPLYDLLKKEKDPERDWELQHDRSVEDIKAEFHNAPLTRYNSLKSIKTDITSDTETDDDDEDILKSYFIETDDNKKKIFSPKFLFVLYMLFFLFMLFLIFVNDFYR